MASQFDPDSEYSESAVSFRGIWSRVLEREAAGAVAGTVLSMLAVLFGKFRASRAT